MRSGQCAWFFICVVHNPLYVCPGQEYALPRSMKKFPMIVCALCAFVASAAGQSSKLRELIRSDPRFAYSPVPLQERSVTSSPLFDKDFTLTASDRSEESFEEWVEKKPGHHDWLSVGFRKVKERFVGDDSFDLLRLKPGPDILVRVRPSGKGLLRYGWAPRQFSGTLGLNFKRALGMPFSQMAMDALSF